MIYLLLLKSWEISRRLNFQGLVVGAKRLLTPAIRLLFLKSFGSGAISSWMTFHSIFPEQDIYSNLKWRSGRSGKNTESGDERWAAKLKTLSLESEVK